MRPAVVFAAALAVILALALSGDGRAAFPGANGKIVFQSIRDGNSEIYSMNPDGSAVTNLTNHPESDQVPTVSPDGSMIAFASTRDDDLSEIYTMDISGGNIVRLTFNPESDFSPAWSPDGSMIVFTRDSQVTVMNANGSGQDALTASQGLNFSPAWSPDGARIAFWTTDDSAANGTEIMVVNADGSGVAQAFASTPASEEYPNWSPDGNQLAFSSDRDGNDEIYVAHINQGIATNLTNNPADDSAPAWSPDGTAIVFQSRRDGGDREIYTMSSAGANQTNRTNNTGVDWFADWQPLAVATPTAAPSLTASATPEPALTQGDVNCDGEIDAEDELQIFFFSVDLDDGNPPPCPDLFDNAPGSDFPWGDVNCDGNVDAIDALYLIAFRAGFLLEPSDDDCVPIGDNFT